ncbi:hypothetical protein HHI36_019469 [Cryptolaemus montrouzieri]|uniref:Ig-like domain-containing protein n=1 Tax=Cryptolaemus montrouzieri TaxID=559131 RepID=A0ABD2P300_9CUCU
MQLYAVPLKDDAGEGDDLGILADEDADDENIQRDADNNYYDDVEDPANKETSNASTEKVNNQFESPAKILTPEKIFEKDIGDTVFLPCQTASKDESVIIWYKDGSILFQGTVEMGAKTNNKFMDDNSIQISNITADDGGQYKCVSVVSKNNEASITHTLKVRTPPSVLELHAKDNQSVLSVGQELVLTCHAKGYPEPVISWHKETIKEGKTVNERLGLTGNTLTIPEIARKDEGRYLCFADNKVGQPALGYINIELTHPPIVSIEKIIVSSDHDMDTELKCTVKAKPTANVIWLRNGNNLKSTEHVHLLNEGNDHILILKGLKESDFGKYVCLAKNYLGTVERSISLVKTPAVNEFIKPEKPTKDLVLTWKVESKTPITEHELQYRRKGESNWISVKPVVHGGEDGVYIIKTALKGLGDGTYETRCRSQNHHGWSDFSDITIVEGEKTTTPPPDVALSQQPESEVGESKRGNSSTSLTGSLFLSSIALLYVYFLRL